MRTDEDSLYRESREQEHVAVSAYAGFAVAFVFAIFGLLGNLWPTPAQRNILIVCGLLALIGAFLWLQVRNMIIFTRRTAGVTFLRVFMNIVFVISQIFVFGALALFISFLWSNLTPGDVDVFGIHLTITQHPDAAG